MLTIAYIADCGKPVKEKPLTKQQKLHRDAVASLAARKIHDAERAKRKFASLWAEIEALEKKHNINH